MTEEGAKNLPGTGDRADVLAGQLDYHVTARRSRRDSVLERPAEASAAEYSGRPDVGLLGVEQADGVRRHRGLPALLSTLRLFENARGGVLAEARMAEWLGDDTFVIVDHLDKGPGERWAGSPWTAKSPVTRQLT